MAANSLNAETKSNDIDESSVTIVNTTKICYTCRIQDFDFQTEGRVALKSPIFLESMKDEYAWQLIFYPNNETVNHNGFSAVSLIFLPGKKIEVDAHGEVSLWTRNLSPTTVQFPLRKFNEAQPVCRFPRICTSNLREYMKGLYLPDLSRIECKIFITQSVTRAINNYISEKKELEERCRLQNYVSDLFETPKFCDVTLIDITSGREIQAHKMILAARSPVFASMFDHKMKEQQENRVEIIDIEYDVLREMLRYIYTGKIENVEKSADGLLVAADKYELKMLKNQCEKALSKIIVVKNAASLLLLGDLHSAVHLKNKVLDFISANTKDVIKTTSYQTLHRTHPYLIDQIVQAFSSKNN